MGKPGFFWGGCLFSISLGNPQNPKYLISFPIPRVEGLTGTSHLLCAHGGEDPLESWVCLAEG